MRGRRDTREPGGAPEALLAFEARDELRLALGRREQLGAEGPESGAAQQRHHGRQQGQRRKERAQDACGGHRAEGLVGVEVGEEQAQERDDDGGAGGQDRLPGGFPGRERGGGAVGGVRQGLAEARHVEQGVVGGGADHQDGEDALALAVELDPAQLRHSEDQQDGGAEREDRGEQHGDRQQQRAVDDQQDQEHGREGHEQQDAVDAGERTDQVRGQPGRAGHEGAHAFGRGGLHLVPELLDDRFHLIGGGDGHHELDGLRVLRRDRTDHGAAGLQGLELALERGGLAELRAGESGIAFDHDDGRDLLGVAELGLPVLRLGGLGAGGQERGLVVGGDLAQPTERGAADPGDGQPGDHQDGGDQPAQPERDTGGVLPVCVSWRPSWVAVRSRL